MRRVMGDRNKVLKRFNKLSEVDKESANKIVLNQFQKPVKHRISPETVLFIVKQAKKNK